MEVSTLRPGLLVSMKTSLEGGVSYRKKVIEGAHLIDNGMQRAKWETVRTIVDPVEHDHAVKTRAKIRNTVAAVCAGSAFGLLCPENEVEKLESAIAEGRKLAKEFNETAKASKINLYVMTGRIAPDDAEAIRAINSEIADLIKTMSDGLKALDVKAVREAANKARSVATMLTGEAADKVSTAIAEARKAAKALVKAGDSAAVELDHAILQSLAEARTAFLDVETDTAEVVAPEAETRALDLAPENTGNIEGELGEVVDETERDQMGNRLDGVGELPDLELAERE